MKRILLRAKLLSLVKKIVSATFYFAKPVTSNSIFADNKLSKMKNFISISTMSLKQLKRIS